MTTTAQPEKHSLFTALRYPQFRLYWSALVCQITSQQMLVVTMGWLAYDITGSPMALGIINLLGAIPRIVLNMVGGVLADRLDVRYLIAVAQAVTTIILAGLATLTFAGLVEVWHLAAAAFLIGLVQSLDEPSRQALFPKLLPDRSLIAAAVPLVSLAWSSTRIIAPAIAGFVIVWTGAAVMVGAIRLIRTGPIARETSRNMLRNLVDGARYAWSNKVFRVVISMAFMNATFGMGYTLVLPVFQDVFHVDARGLGLMYSATGAGAISGLLTYHRVFHRAAPGRIMLTGIISFGILLATFSLTPWFPVALMVLFFIGVTHAYHHNTAEVVLQTLVPDHLRGRVMGLYGMLWSIVPLGGALLNAIAEFTGARAALLIGASVVLAFVLLVCLPNAALRNVPLGN